MEVGPGETGSRSVGDPAACAAFIMNTLRRRTGMRRPALSGMLARVGHRRRGRAVVRIALVWVRRIGRVSAPLRPARRPSKARSLDGDTQRPVAGATVSAAGSACRRTPGPMAASPGPASPSASETVPETISVTADGYGTWTIQEVAGQARRYPDPDVELASRARDDRRPRPWATSTGPGHASSWRGRSSRAALPISRICLLPSSIRVRVTGYPYCD